MRAGPPPRKHQLVTIAFTVIALVVLLSMRRQCAEGTGGMFRAFDAPAGQKPLDSGAPRD